jgi:LPS-assembly protein
MRLRRGLIFFGSVLAALWGYTSSFGQDAQTSPQKPESPIIIDADSLSVNRRTQVLEAQGNVEIHHEEMILKADQVRVNQATQDADANGKVFVDHRDGWLKGESVHLNLEKETGEIERGEIFLENNQLSLSGRRFEKFTGQVYHVDEGFFTTCLCESGPPSWKIAAETIDLQRGGDAVVKGATFYLLDYPIFYFPYAVFPVRTERQTGLLFPNVGYSGKDGFQYQQPFFWAISRNSDATIAPDIEGVRAGILGEYRHVFSRDTQGQITLSYFNEWHHDTDGIDPHLADPNIPKNRWSVTGSHQQGTPAELMTFSDIAVFSDDLFTRDLLHAIDLSRSQSRLLKTSRFSPSRLGFVRSWEETELRGTLDYYQDFIQPQTGAFQRIPQMVFRGSRFFGETIPLQFLWRAEGLSYIREKGADGLRFDLHPQLLLPFRLASYLSGSFGVAPRETFYYLYRTTNLSDPSSPFERTTSRSLAEITGNIGTSLTRVFSFPSLELKELKHVFEPSLSYLFISGANQQNIPIMDEVDRINRRNILTFSLMNRFWGKFVHESSPRLEDQDIEILDAPATTELREMGHLNLALSYDINAERRGGDTLSDLDMRLVLHPLRYIDLGLNLGINPGPWNLQQAGIGFSIRDPRPITRRVLDPDFVSPNRIDLSYRYMRRNFLSPLGNNANLITTPCPPTTPTNDCLASQTPQDVVGSLNINLSYRLTDHLLVRLASNYDTPSKRFTSNRGTIKILSQCECWVVQFSLNQSTNPNRVGFDFQFMLLGLGSSGTSVGSQPLTGFTR